MCKAGVGTEAGGADYNLEGASYLTFYTVLSLRSALASGTDTELLTVKWEPTH